MNGKISKKDGFCRAPRVEIVAENDHLEMLDFDELLVKAAIEAVTLDTMSTVTLKKETGGNG